MKVIIAIPAYNEEDMIQDSLFKLDYFLRQNLPELDYEIIVSDNASTDLTRLKVEELMSQISRLRYLFVPQKGKGLAIRQAWDLNSEKAEIFVFMDADLATDLNALSPMLKAMDTCDLCIGDRYHPDSKVERIKRRKVASHVYRLLIRNLLKSKISDFPCGFKAINKKTMDDIVPLVKNDSWFFDSELIYRAEKSAKKITQIPVKWRDPRPRVEQSKVNIPKVAWQYLKEIFRLKKGKV